MSSQLQIDANRRNAQLSTGPVTPQGKAVVSLNAFKHGIRSDLYMQNWQERDEFNALCLDLIKEFQPQSVTEEIYIERMAISHPKLATLEPREEELATFDEYDRRVVILHQQQTRLERSYDRARASLLQIRKERKAEAGKQIKETEVKQQAKEVVTEALQMVSVLRKAESALKHAQKPEADPEVAPTDTEPAAPPTS